MIHIYSTAQQGTGSFDDGSITEQKPIGFRGEGSSVLRVGPLFYWAWGHVPEEGFIPPHPHQQFEIITYVLNGKAHHEDSLGSSELVETGGAQLIQAGSGVQHSEKFIGPNGQFFQIWFEPPRYEALQLTPHYASFTKDEFPVHISDEGNEAKIIIGENSPLKITTNAQFMDIHIQSGTSYVSKLSANESLAIVSLAGHGLVYTEPAQKHSFSVKDFIVFNSSQASSFTMENQSHEQMRLALIKVPTSVPYSLYEKKQ